jgi:hypothetical protein
MIYTCVKAYKGKLKVEAETTYEAAEKAASSWHLKSTAGIDVWLHASNNPINQHL